MLKTIRSERTIFVDIDDTLVMHEADKDIPGAQYALIKDPVTAGIIRLRINEPMLRLVHEELSRGSQVFIWSRGGYQWAENVAVALALDAFLKDIYILTKPFAYFDDSDVSSWMKDRVYLSPDTVYKK